MRYISTSLVKSGFIYLKIIATGKKFMREEICAEKNVRMKSSNEIIFAEFTCANSEIH